MDKENDLIPAEETSLEVTDNEENNNDVSEITEQPAEPLEPARFVAKTTLNAQMQLEASKQLAPKFGMVTSIIGIGLMVVLLGITVWQYFTTKANDRLLMAGGVKGLGGGLVGPPDLVADRIERYRSIGITCMMLRFLPVFAGMDRFARDVMPRVSSPVTA